jgi:inosose dehydratase
MKIGYPTITWGGVVGTPQGVTSVADLHYKTYGDTQLAVREIAEAGYAGVEVFDGNLLEFESDPSVFNGWLEEAGIELVSVYTGANFIYRDILDDEMHKISRAAELAARFGAKHLVLGGGAKRAEGARDGDLEALAHGLDRAVDIATAHGLTSSYHPHLGTLVETPEALVRLMGLSTVPFCPDTAHLAGGGGDPAALIRQFADRLAHVHLKDIAIATTTFLPLGEGDLDFVDIVAAVREAGYDGWLMVELDYYDGAPKDAAAISKRFLDKLLADER